MALILLALGVAMSLVGVAAMAAGYPIIEIERGWASLITGAILLSGGLVVVSLGLVVRHLVSLRRALSAVGALPQATGAPVPQPMIVPTPLTSTPLASTPLASTPPTSTAPSPAMPAAAQLELPQAAAPGAAVIPIAAAALAGGAIFAHEAQGRPAERFADHAPADGAHDHDRSPALEESRQGEHQGELHPEELFRREPHRDESLHPEPLDQEPFHEEPEPVAAAMPDEPRFAMPKPGGPKTTEDLLDEAFSDFDYEMANGHPRSTAVPEAHPPEPPHAVASTDAAHPLLEPEPPAHESHDHESHDHEPAAHESSVDAPREPVAHEPARDPAAEAQPDAVTDQAAEHAVDHDHATAAPTAPAEPAADLAVIGRYDSEGTSYVMYSDGSIEAQSEAGVYRFGSMAELKAFIEG